MPSTITAGAMSLAGDPDAIRVAGRNWRTAAMACAAASAQVGAVAVVDGFLGDEAATWEQRIRPETSDLLSTLATARDIVGGALVSYADVLEDCQQELRALTVLRGQVGAELDRWHNTPNAAPDLIDSTTQTLHDLGARAAAILARHTAGVRACIVQIDRAAAMSPSHVAGIRSGLNRAPGIGGGPGRFRQSSNAVMAGFALTHPSQTSAIGPFLATDNPRDAVSDSDSREPAPRPWIDPSLQADYRDRFYNACLGTKTGTRIPGDNTEMLCGVNADAIVKSRENILIGLRTYPLALTQEEVYGLDDALADGWDLFTTFMFSGCKTGGSIGACIFDIVSAPIPFAKGAKAVKAGVELVEDGADVVKAGERAVDAEKAGEKAADADKATEARPPNGAADHQLLPGQIDVRVQHGPVPSKAQDVLDVVDSTGQRPAGLVGGRKFQNDGRDNGARLPDSTPSGHPVTYREWDVNPKPKGGMGRGKERLVTGSDGSAYYTSEHYDSFVIIREGTT